MVPIAQRGAPTEEVVLENVPVTRRLKPSILSHAVSGTVGSMLAEGLLFPVDTVRLQVQTNTDAKSSGFLSTGVEIVMQSGLCGLYRGFGASILKETVHSLNFWIFHGVLFKYASSHDDTSRTPPMRRLLLNLAAKQLNWLCTVPFEVISNVNQLSPGSPGFLATAGMLYNVDGMGAFYRGLAVSLILAINPAIMNTLITSLLRLVTLVRQARGEDYVDARDHNAAVVGMATGISKGIATVLTYPLIRAKVLQQTNGTSGSLQRVLRQIVAREGVAGLYRGMLAMSYKTVLWNSLMMAFKHLLGPKRAMTPPASPRAQSFRRMPLMAREPFPVELLTAEKLDEILGYLQVDRSVVVSKRLESLEKRLDETVGEIGEVKTLVKEMLARGISIRDDAARASRSSAAP